MCLKPVMFLHIQIISLNFSGVGIKRNTVQMITLRLFISIHFFHTLAASDPELILYVFPDPLTPLNFSKQKLL